MFGIDPDAKRVTQEELVKILKDLDSKGMVPVSFTSVTKLTTRKPTDFNKFELTGYSGKNGQTWFMKVSQVNGNIGIVYEEKVNREREKQGLDKDFEAQKSPYEYVTKGLRKKGDQYYLAFYPISNASDFDQVIIGLRGEFEVVDKNAIADLIPERKSSSSNKQGLEEGTEVKYETVSLGSLVALRLDGVSYVISDIDQPRCKAWELAFQ